MSNNVDMYVLFPSPVTDGTTADVIRFCRNRAHPDTDTSNPGAVAHELETDATRIGFTYEDIQFTLRVNPATDTVPDVPRILLRIDELYFRPREGLNTTADVIDHSSQLTELAVELYEYLVACGRTPAYVWGLGPGDVEVLTTPGSPEEITAASIRDGRVTFIAWSQILPPDVVANLGREALLRAPAFRTEQLSDGGVLLVVDTSPTMIESNYEPEAVASHLSI